MKYDVIGNFGNNLVSLNYLLNTQYIFEKKTVDWSMPLGTYTHRETTIYSTKCNVLFTFSTLSTGARAVSSHHLKVIVHETMNTE